MGLQYLYVATHSVVLFDTLRAKRCYPSLAYVRTGYLLYRSFGAAPTVLNASEKRV